MWGGGRGGWGVKAREGCECGASIRDGEDSDLKVVCRKLIEGGGEGRMSIKIAHSYIISTSHKPHNYFF